MLLTRSPNMVEFSDRSAGKGERVHGLYNPELKLFETGVMGEGSICKSCELLLIAMLSRPTGKSSNTSSELIMETDGGVGANASRVGGEANDS